MIQNFIFSLTICFLTLIRNSNADFIKYYKRSAIENKADLVLDFLSIGSLSLSDNILGQNISMATHKSVRSFWWMTENDDSDRQCTSKLDPEEYLDACRNSKVVPWEKSDDFDALDKSVPNFLTKRLRNTNFSLKQLLSIEGYTVDGCVGWLCAQRRPGFAIGKRGEAYRNNEDLPDYLILMDDDTYINIDLFVSYMETEDPSKPLAYAGRIFPLQKNYTFPWGGFGVIFSRGSLMRLIQPLHCVDDVSHRYSDEFETIACERLNQNVYGERALYKQGMSISDLAYAISSRHYFCMHSDHLTGYLINHYLLSEAAPEFNKGGRIIKYSGMALNKECYQKTHICHKMTLAKFVEMKNLSQ